ncbi:luciferase-like monooxygenase family protein [Mycolicibacterium hassiacum DSM 44199]|uniref:Luciferase-like monooxygenase family protein n=1 Tax=Mycolicibacterium hassiacum (strain DSM 44199 / CIP 105218 / JCM 12690 / 3849) TaxID=1122247 RepID=K5B8S6_MYCHD|nr:luciferase-like monooxygenase family protein [Mycolicibacterium hassiacum DSM 44199]
MLDNELRHPVDVAREKATVAAISGGRFELVPGAGHMRFGVRRGGAPRRTGRSARPG